MDEEIEVKKEKIEAKERFGEPSKKTGIKAIHFVDYIFWIIEGFIIIRFIFKLVAANTQNAFVTFVYGVTNPFVVFFQGIVKDITTPGGSVFEISSLITLVILWLLYLAIVKLINIYVT